MIDNIKEFDKSASFEQLDHLFENQGGDKGFRLVSDSMGGYFDEAYVGRSAAVADFDNDGDFDIAVNNMGGPGLLIQNNVGQDQGWIGFKLKGAHQNPDAIGAKVRVTAGDHTMVQEVRGTVALGSFSDLRLIFGLGEKTQIDSIEIRWPRGKILTLDGKAFETGKYHEILEPTK